MTDLEDNFNRICQNIDQLSTAYSHDEEGLVRNLEKLINFWDAFEVKRTRNDHYARYLEICMKILQVKPLENRVMDMRYTLRNTTVKLLDLIQQREPRGDLTFNQIQEDKILQTRLIKTCFNVIMTDSEENAEIPFRIIEDYLNRMQRKEPNIIDLAEFREEVLLYCHTFLQHLAAKPNAAPVDEPQVIEKVEQPVGAAEMVPSGADEPMRLKENQPVAAAEPDGHTSIITQPIRLSSLQQQTTVIAPPNAPINRNVPLLSQGAAQAQPNLTVDQPKAIETLGCHSLNFGSLLRNLAVVRWRYTVVHQQAPIIERVCDDIKEDLVKVLEFYPQRPPHDSNPTHQQLDQFKLECKKFVLQLESMVSISEILVILIQYNPESMRLHMHNYFCFFKNLLQYVPAYENQLRNKMLYYLNQSLELIFALQPSQFMLQPFRETNHWHQFQLEARRKVYLFAEYLLDTHVVLGAGSTSHEVLVQVNIFIKTLFDNLGKDPSLQNQYSLQHIQQERIQFSNVILAKAMKILLECMNNKLMPGKIKNQYLINLHGLTQQFVRNCDSRREWKITNAQQQQNLPIPADVEATDFLDEVLYCLVEQSTQMSEMLKNGKEFLDMQEHRLKKNKAKQQPATGSAKPTDAPKISLRSGSASEYQTNKKEKRRRFMYESSSSSSDNEEDPDSLDESEEEIKPKEPEKQPTEAPKDSEAASKEVNFIMNEHYLVEAYTDNFSLNWLYTKASLPPFRDTLKLEEQLNVVSYSITKNIFLFVGFLLECFRKARKQNNQNSIGTDFLILKEIKLLKKLMLNGSLLIQRISDTFPQPYMDNDDKKILENFDKIFLKMRPSYFRDLLHACGDEIFGQLVYVKAQQTEREDVGICHFMQHALEINAQVSNHAHPEYNVEIVSHFLELFAKYLMERSNMFNLSNEFTVPLCGLSPADRKLATLPYGDVQEAIQDFLEKISKQTMKRFSEFRCHDTFFSVFVFCVRQIHSGYFARMYFKILRNFLLYVEDTDEQQQPVIKSIKADFMPLVQGLLETFLQRKEESTQFRELWQEIESNEINCMMPAKPKQLLDQLPQIMKSVVDCLRASPNHSQHYQQQIQIGIQALKDWIQLLNLFPELLDPVVNQVLPELNLALGQNMYHMPQQSQRLMAKLGAKTRQYNEDYKISTRNYAEDGLNFKLRDKHSGKTVVLGVDAFINSILYAPVSPQGIHFVRNVFFCYVDPHLDLDYLVASIALLRDQEPSASLFEQAEVRLPKVQLHTDFSAKNNPYSRQQQQISQMIRGSESHTFEKILRYMFATCTQGSASMSKNGANRKYLRFMRWVARYFTLIYIIRNGQLMQTRPDEINPLLFIELLNYFFFYINLHYYQAKQHRQSQARAQYNGSVVALKTMLRLLSSFYGDRPEIFDQLEIVRILIKKICQITNLAVNIALQVLIKELPAQTIVQHIGPMTETLFQLLNTASDSIVKQIENEIYPTLIAILVRVDILPMSACAELGGKEKPFREEQTLTISNEDRQKLFELVVDKLAQNLLSQQGSSRQLATRILKQIATHQRRPLSEILAQVKCSIYSATVPRPPPQAGQPPLAAQPQQVEERISWSQYFITVQIEKKSKDILEMFKGGYTQLKHLMSYFELVQFVLENTDGDEIFKKKHVFLGISDLMILILESESERFESVAEQVVPNVLGDPLLARLGRRYMKLEKIYVSQNKEYDPYSFSLHAHPFLSKNHFEVQMRAREEAMRMEIEELLQRQSHNHLNIFKGEEQNKHETPNFTKLADEATQVLPDSLHQNMVHHLKKQVTDFQNRHFPPAPRTPRPQDIRFEYLKQLHEIYPNVRMHVDLQVKILTVLCDIMTHAQLSEFMKDRYEEFYNIIREAPQQPPNSMAQPAATRSILKTRLDFYAVEIQSKIICSFFKFFLRDELSIQKRSKQCLKRMIRLHNNSMIPRTILNECVKPILNTVQRNTLLESQFQHFGMLIKILTNCFNDQLIKHLIDSYYNLQQFIMDVYKTRYFDNMQAAAAAAAQQQQQQIGNIPDAAGNIPVQPAVPGDAVPAADPADPPIILPGGIVQMTTEQRQEELQMLVDQYNQRVGVIEVICGIINNIYPLILHKFMNVGAAPANNNEKSIIVVFKETLVFQDFIINHFDLKFDQQLARILGTNTDEYQRYRPLALKKLTSLQVKIGFLCSDLQEGMAKIFNFHQPEAHRALELVFSDPTAYMQPVLSLFKLKDTVCLRERIQRENLFYRLVYNEPQVLANGNRDYNFNIKIIVDLIFIVSKFYPPLLTQHNNNQVLDILRGIWIRRLEADQFLPTETRRLYSRIQRILVIYCRNENSDIQILFDLLKCFQTFFWLDMSPLIDLCTNWIPNQPNKKRKIKIMETTLNKILTSRCDYEQKYMMFEFAFMPCALQCQDNQEMFNDLFQPQLIRQFIETFFTYINDSDPRQVNNQRQKEFWWVIFQKLEEKQQGFQISYESFFVEIIKVLAIIVKQLPSYIDMMRLCSPTNYRMIFRFLMWVQKKTKQASTKEHVYYTMSLFGMKLYGLEESLVPTVNVAADSQQHEQQQMLMESLESVLSPILEHKRNAGHANPALMQHAFTNMARIVQSRAFERHRVINHMHLTIPEPLLHSYFKRRYSHLKEFSDERISLCNLITKNQDLFFTRNQTHMEKIIERMKRTIGHIKENQQNNMRNMQGQIVLTDLQNSNNALSYVDTLQCWIEKSFADAQQTMDPAYLRNQMDLKFQEQWNQTLLIFDTNFDYLMHLHSVYEEYGLIRQRNQTQPNNHPVAQAAQLFPQAWDNLPAFITKCQDILVRIIGQFAPRHNFQAWTEDRQVRKLVSNGHLGMSDRRNWRIFFYLNLCHLLLKKDFCLHHVFTQVIALLDAGVLIVLQKQEQQQPANSMPQILDESFGKVQNFQVQFCAIELIADLIRKRNFLHESHVKVLRNHLCNQVSKEIRHSLNKDIQNLQDKIVDNFNKKQRNHQTSEVFQHMPDWEPQQISSIVPHFTIRLIRKLSMMIEAGELPPNSVNFWLFDADSDTHMPPQGLSNRESKSNKVFGEIITIVQKLACSFRSEIFSEKVSDQSIMNQKQEQQKKDSTIQIPVTHFEDTKFFPIDFAALQPKEPGYSIYVRETLIIAIKLAVTHLKSPEMHQDEAILAFDQLRTILKVFHNYKTDIYTLGQLYEITKLLVEEKSHERLKIVAKEKAVLLSRMMCSFKLKDFDDSQQKNKELIDQMYSLCLDFLEVQPQLLNNEYNQKLYVLLFVMRPRCSYKLRQRIFALFEKFNGNSLKAKMNFYFDKLIKDDKEMFLKFTYVQNFLEFTLFNFYEHEDTLLFDIKMTSSLCPFYSSRARVDATEVVRTQMQDMNLNGKPGQRKNFTEQVYAELIPFVAQHKKFCKPTLNSLLRPLSEIVKQNPEHTHDKNISEKIFTKLFWQYWNILDRDQQQFLGQAFNKMFLNLIQQSSHLHPNVKLQFARAMLEAIVAIQGPSPRIEPEVLQYMGKHFKLWHVALPLLESHTVEMFLDNERYVHALNELYRGLMEEDMQAGLRRLCTESPEMRTLITFGQHHNWEQLNSLFGQYINFYAEQEGLYVQLEELQSKPGKYSRQLERAHLIDCVQPPPPPPGNQQFGGGNAQPENTDYCDLFENEQFAEKLKSNKFPKRSNGNEKVSELDLRMWETLYVESLRVLNKYDRLNDVASSLNSQEIKLECMWQNSPDYNDEELRVLLVNMLYAHYSQNERRHLIDISHYMTNRNNRGGQLYETELEVPRNSIQRIRYQIYLSYVLLQKQVIHQSKLTYANSQQAQEQMMHFSRLVADDIKAFDENYRETMRTMLRQYDEQLPSYIDRIQHEYLILLQVAIESQEAKNICQVATFQRLAEQRDAFKTWRLRLPHMHESIQTWKQILENRNFCFDLLKKKFSTSAGSTQAAGGEQNHDKVMDTYWNKLQLARVARKHGLPSLAQQYLNQVKRHFSQIRQHQATQNHDQDGNGEPHQNAGAPDSTLKVEKFLHTYETLKGQMHVIENSASQSISLEFQATANDYMREADQYDPWMNAEILRLQGEFGLAQGNLVEAKAKITQSIEKNKKEAKTWLAYAKLNEIVFTNARAEQDKDRSVMNSLKGYLFAVTLAQHKSKLIIPFVLKLIKTPSLKNKRDIAGFIKLNVDQMPVWIWIFWLPQLIQLMCSERETLWHIVADCILQKVCHFYPQPSYFSLKAKQSYSNNAEEKKPFYQLEMRKIAKHRDYKNLKFLIDQFRKVKQMSMDEKLLIYVQITLSQFSNYLDKSLKDVEKKTQNFFETKLFSRLNVKQPAKGDPNQLPVETEGLEVIEEIKQQFEKHILNKDTAEKNFLDQLRFIKGIKDYLKIHKNLKQQELHLQEVFPKLANFQTKGIELPGQHIMTASNVIAGEPLPERAILIEKFEPAVFRSGIDQKKVHFKCNNGKIYAFVVTSVQSNKNRNAKELQMFNSDERLIQLKVISNLLFLRHKESAKRGIKFHVAPTFLLPSAKLTQDDLTCIDLQETHDYLLQERGLDPDLAMLMQIEHLEKIFSEYGEDKPKLLSTIEKRDLFDINWHCYSKMVKVVEPNLLTSYFHRIFYNVDHLFIFKKQFTRYHATNSLFAYAFNLNDNLSLEKMSFCKETGRITFAESNILKNAIVKKKEFAKNFVDVIEQDNFVKEQLDNKHTQEFNYVPFRLTKNFEHFIGPIGLQGLFAGVMTAGALAITANKNKYLAFLRLLFQDEITDKDQAAPEEVAEYCMFKIQSLCSHQRCIEYTQKSEDAKAQPLPQQRSTIQEDVENGNYKLGQHYVPKSFFDIEMDRPNMPYEYNEKVFALIEMACDDERRSQKPVNWCSWF